LTWSKTWRAQAIRFAVSAARAGYARSVRRLHHMWKDLVWISHRIAAELSAGPMPFDCGRIVYSGVGRLIAMEE